MAINQLNNIVLSEDLFRRTTHNPADLRQLDQFPGMDFVSRDYKVGKDTVTHYIAVLGSDDAQLGFVVRVQVGEIHISFALRSDREYLSSLKRLFNNKALWMNAYIKSQDDLDTYKALGEKLAMLFWSDAISKVYENSKGYTLSYSRNNLPNFTNAHSLIDSLLEL